MGDFQHSILFQHQGILGMDSSSQRGSEKFLCLLPNNICRCAGNCFSILLIAVGQRILMVKDKELGRQIPGELAEEFFSLSQGGFRLVLTDTTNWHGRLAKLLQL